MCEICGFNNIADEVPDPFTESDFNSLINETWNGIVTKYNLPVSFYAKTIQNLNKGVNKGFGKDIFSVEFGTPDYEMLRDLTDNIQVFSGAKTYQQVRSLTDLLKDQKLKSNFYAFKEKATPILKDYNEAYLKAEYNTAIGSSRMAGEWMRIETDKDILPLLQYETVGDSRVRPEHAALDNIIRPVNDKFWDTLYPPNGWNCRCTVLQLSEGSVTDLRGRTNLYDNVPEMFRMNVGKDKIIFKEKGEGKHPYFSVAKGDKEFAKKNFGLPVIAPPKK
jgi:SPP1 gp7 family putative phage head morphogenesis protein